MPGVADAQTLGRTDPNGGLFPDSSVVDFQGLLDPPAGKYGFLQVDKNGRFAWPDGKRAKFWGVNISNKSVWASKDTIDKVVDVLARSGTNMVRFEALDSTGALLDSPHSDTTRVIDGRKLQILDYWIAKIRERGIYYYFDLLDFRQFKEGDEVPGYDQIGRAAKPYAFFDRRLIDLQKEYARQLLTHQNPLTGLRYMDDPGLALVEICNEHGLFLKANQLDTLVEPYGTAFRQQWNRWLVQQYGSRDGLKAAWGRVAETDVLQDSEDPAIYSVKLPLFTPAPPPSPAPQPTQAGPAAAAAVVDIRRAPNRMRDGVRFLYETQRGYFREMKAALREMGLKVPVTGVVSNEYVPDVASVAAECDFTSENYYADHPAFVGKEWEGTFFYNDNDPLRGSSPYQIAPWLAALRWDNKPVVVREWATVWPNRYRAIAVPEMLAYSSLQDFDAVLLFGYQIERDPDRLSDFDHQADPTVWGLYALGAQAFLRGDIRPASCSATLQQSPDTLYRWPNSVGNLHRLAWFVRLNSAFEPPSPVGAQIRRDSLVGALIQVGKGVAAPQGREGAQIRRNDLEAQQAAPLQAGAPLPPVHAMAASGRVSAPPIHRKQRVAGRPRNRLAAIVHHRLRPVAHSRTLASRSARGDGRRYGSAQARPPTRPHDLIRPHSVHLTVRAGDSSVLPLVLDQFRQAGVHVSSKTLETGCLAACGGQVVRNVAAGLLTIDTPCTLAICGELPVNQALRVGDWTLISPTEIGALMAVSLDGMPLSRSHNFVVKMVSRAENTEQDLEPADAGAPARFHLKAWGKAPVLTFGRPGRAMILRRGAIPVVSLALEDGTWELLVQDAHATLVCDTPGIRGTLFGHPIATTADTPVTVDLLRPIGKATASLSR